MESVEEQFASAFWEAFPSPSPNWVEWQHVSEGLTHCPVCLKLDKCWFLNEKKPMLPQHPHCHCRVEPIPSSRVVSEAIAECRLSKFEGYIFNPKYKDNGKGALFEGWGYSILDSQMLKEEYEKQALEKYIKGDYELGKLDKDGQRISILIEVTRRDKDTIAVAKSGWMVYPNGKIELITPLAGGKKK